MAGFVFLTLHFCSHHTGVEQTEQVGDGFWAGNIPLQPREVGIEGQLPPFPAIITDHNPTPASTPVSPQSLPG